MLPKEVDNITVMPLKSPMACSEIFLISSFQTNDSFCVM